MARKALGKPGPPIGKTRYSAIRRAMGLTGRYVFVSAIQEWLKDHPNFSAVDVYPSQSHRNIPSNPPGANARKRRVPRRTHD